MYEAVNPPYKGLHINDRSQSLVKIGYIKTSISIVLEMYCQKVSFSRQISVCFWVIFKHCARELTIKTELHLLLGT